MNVDEQECIEEQLTFEEYLESDTVIRKAYDIYINQETLWSKFFSKKELLIFYNREYGE